MSSAVTRLFGGSANAAEPGPVPARETVTASLPESKLASNAPSAVAGGSFESRWSAFR
jgi:hypothetical protein